ncbi:MAG: host-nuclease inhibitor Gam family protein [Paraclostridium sp.]
MLDMKDFLESLEEYKNAKDAEELQIKLTGDISNDRGVIDSPNKANYFLRILQDVKMDIDKVNQTCDEEIRMATERINEFREDSLRSLKNQVVYYEAMLRDFTIREIEGTKKKSVKLPYGTLQLKSSQPKYIYDDSVAIDFLNENFPSFVVEKTTKSINKADLKKMGAIDPEGNLVVEGKVVPGVSIVHQEDTFTVK